MSAPTKAPLAGASMLVVEDDPDIRQMTVTVLTNAGAAVTTASTAEEGLECARSRDFDAVVLDWNLADSTGALLLESLSAERPALFEHSVVVTGDLLSIPGQHDAERLGRPVLAKPFRPSKLVAKLAEILA